MFHKDFMGLSDAGRKGADFLFDLLGLGPNT